MSKTTQDEGEKTAKVWQVNEVSAKLDALMERIEELVVQRPTKDQLDNALIKRDNRLDSLEKTRKFQTKFAWFLLTTYIPVAAIVIWDKIKHL